MKKHTSMMKKDKCSPFSVNNRALFCKQVISSSTFKSQQTNKSYTIFHKVKCSSAYLIYLRKSETSFSIRLSNHRKNVKNPDGILACRHFQERNHVFNKHAKFIILDKLTNTAKSKDVLRQRLKENTFGFKRCKRYSQKH